MDKEQMDNLFRSLKDALDAIQRESSGAGASNTIDLGGGVYAQLVHGATCVAQGLHLVGIAPDPEDATVRRLTFEECGKSAQKSVYRLIGAADEQSDEYDVEGDPGVHWAVVRGPADKEPEGCIYQMTCRFGFTWMISPLDEGLETYYTRLGRYQHLRMTHAAGVSPE